MMKHSLVPNKATRKGSFNEQPHNHQRISTKMPWVLWHSTYSKTNNAMESRRKKSASLKFWGLDDLWSWSSWELPKNHPSTHRRSPSWERWERCTWGKTPKNPMKWWKLYQSGRPKRRIPKEQTSRSLVIGWGRGSNYFALKYLDS